MLGAFFTLFLWMLLGFFALLCAPFAFTIALVAVYFAFFVLSLICWLIFWPFFVLSEMLE